MSLEWIIQVIKDFSYARGHLSSSQTVDFVILLFIFYFHSVYFPTFLFLEQLELGLISYTVSHNLMA